MSSSKSSSNANPGWDRTDNAAGVEVEIEVVDEVLVQHRQVLAASVGNQVACEVALAGRRCARSWCWRGTL